jgi:DNA-binding NtrC family response regulator
VSETLLIVEDEETLRESLRRLFEKEGFRVETVGTAEDAMPRFEDDIFDVVISDILLPGIDGIEMMTRLKESQPEQAFIIMTAYASLDTAVRALRAGAYDYIMKPIMHEEIKQVVRNCLRESRLRRENVLLKREMDYDYDFSRILGPSARIKEVIDEARKVVDTKSNVLVLGETGTGKEFLARVMHANSSRKDMPFVPINCSAIPENLLESELFGHAKGAFTGAVASKPGLFDEADGGTVFLDEIGDMPKNFQVKLLRVIEDHEIRLVGSTKSRKVDLRFITATNRDLLEAVRSGDFREDLYYRINVITLEMPPVRERSGDIPLLVKYFVEKYALEAGKGSMEISDGAMKELKGYPWPGNVRELQNVIERAVLLCDGNVVRKEHLSRNIRGSDEFLGDSVNGGLSIEEYTRRFVQHHQGRLGEQELADRLGITRKTLWEKRKKWGLKKPS